MTARNYDLLAIGNALVDVLCKVDDNELAKLCKKFDMLKGSMNLIDEYKAVEIYADMGPAIEVSGGSAANTMAGFASFGGRGAYISKVAEDQLGDVFRHDIRSIGVDFDSVPLVVGAPTGRCLILITPDAERTMNTFLGATSELSENDIDESLVTSSKVTYMEGYLFDRDPAKRAFRKAGSIARESGRDVSLTLSDSFCVERHRDDFKVLVDSYIDILFANEDELKSLYEVDNFNDAIECVKSKSKVAAITRGNQGSVIITPNDMFEIKASPVNEVIDTTGAGDQYAAGFLYGYTRDMPLEKCGELASLAAGEVIAHLGPRPEQDYSEYLDKVA